MLHLQKVIRGPLDLFADLVAVSWSIKKCSQDQHVKRALKKIRVLLCSFLHRRRSTLGFRVIVDIRLSAVKW